MINNYYLMIN